MVRIRLRRMGAKRKALYRIVVTDSRSPRDGRFIETIGTYDPSGQGEAGFNLQQERAAHWLKVGAQPSDGVARLLRRVNLLDEGGKPVPYTPPATEEAVAA
ncbi:MAG: 30S ribosomal protein S16 [Caldilineaceae bacterium]